MELTHNFVDPAYAEALDIFKKIKADLKRSQIVVTVKGKTVIDLAAGVSPDSLTTVFSVSKALSGISIAKLVGEGKLNLDERMSHYWPEFAQNGKAELTVRQVLSHQCGLTDTDPRLTEDQIYDDHAAAQALAAQKPLWRPGSAFGYHGLTIGHLMSELVFRITGLTMQQYYEKEVRTPADADAYLGLPETLESRVTELSMNPVITNVGDEEKYARPAGWQPGGVSDWGMGQVPLDDMVGRKGRAFGLSSGMGVASARGLVATMQWAVGFGNQTPGVAKSALDDMSQVQVYGYDILLEQDHRSHGTIFMKPTQNLPFGSYKAFGHDGAAGALLYADPQGEIVLGYTVARLAFPGGADRAIQPIIDLVRKVANQN
ncbi:MAG: serine hydrolase domain-containing protein [Micrococcales bacterium]